MAAQFPYNATPDQKQAFLDVDKDLTERETPMDRFICGDVGFGKTEVALRAIFCVVSAGRQAMVLAPTIVLAKQHYDVISEQFAFYPQIKVGLLSRFQTKAEKEAYLEMIKHGHLNIIVGTHSLLGSRVVYSNLGLLVVDEEHVEIWGQAERKDCIFQNVSGCAYPLRNTHTKDIILNFDWIPGCQEKVIKARKNELNRGGQVFYVLPRIKGLEEVMDFLEEAFPNMLRHMRRYPGKELLRYLLLVGCCQQLHGRVGRADKEAQAYLFYPDKSLLSDQALERLSALEECRQLGQGFQLAEKGMGIRGFGTIFCEQQTGDVGNVGIDLFFEMLFESLSKVEELRIFSVPYNQIDININPRLPSEYVNYQENPMEIINEAEKDMWRALHGICAGGTFVGATKRTVTELDVPVLVRTACITPCSYPCIPIFRVPQAS
ncbi:unnamed protein product [Brassica oleracea var. botrytis]